MWLVWAISAFSIALLVACVRLLRIELRAAPRGWQLLATSGLLLALGGVGFILRFWKPAAGPYLANSLYPLGPYLNAWAVSFGFMWLAFGLAFFALAVQAPRTGRLWLALLVGWLLAWLPHGIIGVGFAWAGSNQPSVQLYRDWASTWPGFLRLFTSALILLSHFTLALLGFTLPAADLLRRRRKAAAGAAGVSA